MKEIVAIVLAAGSSSRLGESKQLFLYKSKSLLRHSVEAALQSKCSSVIVVLGANFDAHAAELNDLDLDIVENETWQNGMGNTLKAGLNYLLNNKFEFDGILVMVCDQPMISRSHLDKLIKEFSKRNNPIVASQYSNSAGVPAIFNRTMLSQLLEIPDNKGAKNVIQSSSDAELVDFPGGEIDIDTIDDLKNLT